MLLLLLRPQGLLLLLSLLTRLLSESSGLSQQVLGAEVGLANGGDDDQQDGPDDQKVLEKEEDNSFFN